MKASLWLVVMSPTVISVGLTSAHRVINELDSIETDLVWWAVTICDVNSISPLLSSVPFVCPSMGSLLTSRWALCSGWWSSTSALRPPMANFLALVALRILGRAVGPTWLMAFSAVCTVRVRWLCMSMS